MYHDFLHFQSPDELIVYCEIKSVGEHWQAPTSEVNIFEKLSRYEGAQRNRYSFKSTRTGLH